MFFLQSKLTQFASAISVRHAQRHISIAPGRVLGFFKDKVKEESAEETSVALVEDEFEEEEKLKRIDMIRNKSGLLPQHRNILHGKVPYAQSESWIHNTLKYKRKMYGKFGESSELDPSKFEDFELKIGNNCNFVGICFWTPSELKEKQEYERVAFPKTVPEMIAENQEQKRLRKESILAREAQIQKNLEKLEQWKKDITMRKEKKETVGESNYFWDFFYCFLILGSSTSKGEKRATHRGGSKTFRIHNRSARRKIQRNVGDEGERAAKGNEGVETSSERI